MFKKQHIKSLRKVALSSVITALFCMTPNIAHAAVPPAGNCQAVRLPLTLSASSTQRFTVAGTLCTPQKWAAGPHALDILVPGGMYNSMYWDWPQNSSTYSYVTKSLQAGRATFAYDRLGTGASNHPNSGNITFNTDVYNLHSIVQHYRTSYPQINSIGHSLGSVIVAQEAGQYKDVHRVVLTGLTHGHGTGFIELPTVIYPAGLDPQFKGIISPLDVGYVTTLPGKRAALFYSSSADPKVITYDEAHKDAMTLGVSAGAIASLTIPAGLNITNRITAPVLITVGQQDAPFCNVDMSCKSDSSVYNFEKPYFTGAKSLTARTIPNTGHDLPLHPSANTSFKVINDWLKTH